MNFKKIADISFKLRTRYGFTLFKCVQQVTGTGKPESKYEKEKKRVEYRQTEHIMKIIIGGERLWLVRGLVIQKTQKT